MQKVPSLRPVAAPLRCFVRFTFLSATVSVLPLAAIAQTVIPSGTTRYDADAPGSYILNAGVTRSVTSGGNEVIRIANSGTAGTYTLTVNGTVTQTGTGRGIRTSTATVGVNFDITIGTTGFVQGTVDDAIQGRGGPITVTNLGTLYSGPNFAATPTTPLTAGRGLNLRDAAGGTVVNGAVDNTTALIRSDGGDAVRVGSNFTFTNYGTILGNGRVNDNSANNVFNSAPNNSVAETYSASDGFSFEDQDLPGPGVSNSSLANYGVISGARHGVEAGERGTGITVTNQLGGQIIGLNGSGIGFDTTETDPTKIVIANYGLIRGDYAGAGNVIDRTGNLSPTQDGDGDGIDIDGAATIRNYATGQILATGAGGYDTDGRANSSEAISIGGGVIVNDGLIRGADRGIVVNNDHEVSRSGAIAAEITNNAGATIEGLNGFAIRLENKWGDARDNDTITNAGTIIGNGSIPDADAVVTIQDGTIDTHSAGTLDGVTDTGTGSARFIRGDGSAIQMGEGNDVLTNTGIITGNTGRAIAMEGGDDLVNHNGGTIAGAVNGGAGSDTLRFAAGPAGNARLEGDILNFETIQVTSGTTALAGITITGGTDTQLSVASGATLAVEGALVLAQAELVFASGATFEVQLDGLVAGALADGYAQVLVDGGAVDLGNAALALALGDAFVPTVGDTFTLFNVINGATLTGEFAGLGEGDVFSADGAWFSISYTGGSGHDVVLTSVSAIPEPSTYAAIFGGLALVGAVIYRRRAMA